MDKLSTKATVFGTVALAALTLVSSASLAADPSFKPYVSLFGGASFLNSFTVTNTSGTPYTISTKLGYVVGGTVGVEWDSKLRTELELSHARWNINSLQSIAGPTGGDGTPGTPSLVNVDGSITANYLLGNIWYDVPTASPITPYLGGGLGVGWADATGPVNGGSSGFAWQIGVGAKIAVSDHLDFDAGYRLKDIIGLTFNDSTGAPFTKTDLLSHNFQLALTYKF
jgi:opacity protein-like surface antigen